MRKLRGTSPLLAAGLLVGVLASLVAVTAQSRQPTYIVRLKARANVAAVRGNRAAVKQSLVAMARQTQAPLLARIKDWRQAGKVRKYSALWIVNAFTIQADAEVIDALKADPAVASVVPARPVGIPPRERVRALAGPPAAWGVAQVRASDAWATFGSQGANVVVGVIDSGIDSTHPDLLGKVRAINGWLDLLDAQPAPYDDNGHGTHVAGTIAGGNASGAYVGVAPQATIIAAKFLDANGAGDLGNALVAMQWMLDPDGDPGTADGADVVNCSWGDLSHSPDPDPAFLDAIDAWRAANVFGAFAAGNDGPGVRTMSSPGDYPNAFAVGASDAADAIAATSSRGPANWTGLGDVTKPDIAAPGVAIVSALPGGGYGTLDGTSTACPHVAGTAALIQSYARAQGSSLPEARVRGLLKGAAWDKGEAGPDNTYGWGRVDAYNAVLALTPDANEPNDAAAQATPILFGEQIVAQMSPDSDVDLYQFTGATGTRIEAAVQAEAAGSQVDAVLEVLDRDGVTVLAQSDDANGLDPAIASYALPDDGTFYLKVTNKAVGIQTAWYTVSLRLKAVTGLTSGFDAQADTVTLQWGSVLPVRARALRRGTLVRALALQGYKVYRAAAPQGPYTVLGTTATATTTYTDSTPPAGMEAFYRVTALYSDGESAPSEVRARLAVVEVEPNNDITQAGAMVRTRPAEGMIATDGDIDYFSFQGQQGEVITANALAGSIGSALDPVLLLWDTDGITVLAQSTGGTFDASLSGYLLPTTGTYYLSVEDSAGISDPSLFFYRLSVGNVVDDHGNTPANATAIADEQSVPGVIEHAGDRDFFTFQVTEATNLTAEVMASRSGSLLDGALSLFNEAGELVLWSDDYYDLDPAIVNELIQPGRYYLEVIDYWETGSPSHTYTLSLHLALRAHLVFSQPEVKETVTQGAAADVTLGASNTGEHPLGFMIRPAATALALQARPASSARALLVPAKSAVYQRRVAKERRVQALQAKRAARLAGRPAKRSTTVRAQARFQFRPDPAKASGVTLVALSATGKAQPVGVGTGPAGTWRALVIDPADVTAPGGDARRAAIQTDGTRVYFRVEHDQTLDWNASLLNILLDTDRNATTGSPMGALGVDYNLVCGEASDGVWKYTPLGWTRIADLAWVDNGAGSVEIGAALADIGAPPDFHAAIELWDDTHLTVDRAPDFFDGIYIPVTQDMPWLRCGPVAGVVGAGESVDLALKLDATTLAEGTHKAALYVQVDDPTIAQMRVPVELTVTPAPGVVGVPTLESPADGEVVGEKPTFQMKVLTQGGATAQYRVVLKQGAQQVAVLDQTVSSVGWDKASYASGETATLDVPVAQKLHSGSYTWEAYASANQGSSWSATSGSRALVVNDEPGGPELLGPAADATSDGRPNFQVRATDKDATDALKFKVVVKQGQQVIRTFDQVESATGWSKAQYASGETATFAVPAAQALAAGEYDWSAAVFDGKEWSADSAARHLVVNHVAGAPELVSPADGATVSPTPAFQVSALEADGGTLRFRLLLEQGGKTVATYDQTQSAAGWDKAQYASREKATFTVPASGALASGTYRWTMSAYDGRAWSAGSSRSIVVNRASGVPTLVAPAANAVIGSAPTFQVKATDADSSTSLKFKLEVTQGSSVVRTFDQTADAAGWSKTVYANGETASFTVPAAEALASGEYNWCASAHDGKVWSTSSATRAVRVNDAPSQPKLVGPADKAITADTPTFRLTAMDADKGAKLAFTIVIKRGGDVVATFNQAQSALGWSRNDYDSGDVASFRVPASAALAVDTYKWQATVSDGMQSSAGSETLTFTVSPAVPRVAGGLDTLGLGLRAEDPTVAGLGLATLQMPPKAWDPVQKSYVAPSALEPGRGYWFVATQDAPVSFSGETYTEPFPVLLRKGWNFISSPFLVPTTWDIDRIQVKRAGQAPIPLRQAVDTVEDYAWGWQQNRANRAQGQYTLIYDRKVAPGVDNQLQPWHGYWVKAYDDCELILPVPDAREARARLGDGPAGWSVRVNARVAGQTCEAVVGVAKSGRGLAIGAPPQPPVSSGSEPAVLIDNQAPLVVDVRSDGSAAQEWKLVVKTPSSGGRAAAGEEVTLTWPDMRALPKDVSLTLVDVATGARRYLRTNASYTFRASGEERRFRLISEPRGAARIAVTGVQVLPLRSGRAVQFSLSGAASVAVEVLSPAGQVAASLARGRAAAAGLNTVAWTGTVPNGLYLVRVTATTEDGATVQAIRPVAVVR